MVKSNTNPLFGGMIMKFQNVSRLAAVKFLREAAAFLDSGRPFPMRSSAELCFEDACAALERSDMYACAMWAVKSMEYSAGVFHPTVEAFRSFERARAEERQARRRRAPMLQ
jgi:hypothetical protein